MQTSSSKKYFGIFIILVSAFIIIYVLLTVFPLSLSTFTGKQSPDKQDLYDDFENGTYILKLGLTSPNMKWASMHTGFGSMGVATDQVNKGNHFYEEPKAPISSNLTHSSLAISTKKYQDFELTLDMMTVEQLRKDKPNPWETAWVVWHYTDNYHWYAFQLKTNGTQLEKKDNDLKDDSGEIFLQTKPSKDFKFGTWYKVRILHENSYTNTPHIQVWIDNVKVFDFVDDQVPNSEKLSFGAIGLYSEDASVRFDNVYIKPI
jgi:3-keto-disaccharide hydrolase